MSRPSVVAAAAGASSSSSAAAAASPASPHALPPPLRPPTCVLGCAWLSAFAPGSLLSHADIAAHQSSCPLMDIQQRLAALEAADREAALQALDRQRQKTLLLTQLKAQLAEPEPRKAEPGAETEEEAEAEAESVAEREPAAARRVKQEQEHREVQGPRATRKRGRHAATPTTPAPAAPVKLARSSAAAAVSSSAAAASVSSASASAASSSVSAPRSPSSSGSLAFLHADPTDNERFIDVAQEHLPLQLSSLTPPIRYAGSKLEVFLLEDYHYIRATELFALMTAEGLLTRRPPIPAHFPALTAAASSSDAVAWLEFLRDAWFTGTARSGSVKWRHGFRWGRELSAEVVLVDGTPYITTHGIVNTVLYLAHLPDSIVLDTHVQTKIEELQEALDDAMDSEPAATLRRDEGHSLPGYGRRKNRDGSESKRKPAAKPKGTKSRP